MSQNADMLQTALTPEEQSAYFRWISELGKRYAEEGEQLEEVTVAFTFTPLGTHVVAYTGPTVASGHFIVLRDI